MDQPINEQDYAPDFEISDRYIKLSAELLRLSLLAITGIVTLLYNYKNCNSGPMYDFKYFFIAISGFILCCGASLAHRFYATDCLSYHMAYLRTKDTIEKSGRKKCLKRSEIALIATEYLFGVAIFAGGFALYKWLGI
ncbi:hypothetical protein [Flavobacterium pallidum]|uniref:DUF202 domain-containing protein n=1 Tax=Flavobacterium pallidum TaxID=2172098 RepID=A0A2S1SHK4_9FLAO|nr:hypothetical protein [Flavobacterium pallidum]AWI25894.1 hypothetical protein HYN49_08265 [Flavobacterium pallidum]